MKEIVLQTTVKVCRYEELGEEDRFLVDMARNAAKSSYAPYSRFNVGAAVKLDWGTAVVGGLLISTMLTMYIVPTIYSFVSTNLVNKKQQ
jgi:hypothetical protein